MPASRSDDRLLQDYLLGKLSEEEQVQIEDRAFADADCLAAVESAEADLIDSYVRGELPPPERREFEGRFLVSPQRRDKVEFAKALARVAAESKVSPLKDRVPVRQSLAGLWRGWSPVMQFAAGMAALLVVAGSSWLIVQNLTMRSRMTDLEAQRREMENRESGLRRQLGEEQTRAANLAAQLKDSPDAAGGPVLASLVLMPGLSRAETREQQLILKTPVQLVHIELPLEPRDDFPRFRVELHTRGGDEVLVQSNLPKRQTAAGPAVSFDVSAASLAAGAYELALKGMSGGQRIDVGYYYFRVQRQ